MHLLRKAITSVDTQRVKTDGLYVVDNQPEVITRYWRAYRCFCKKKKTATVLIVYFWLAWRVRRVRFTKCPWCLQIVGGGQITWTRTRRRDNMKTDGTRTRNLLAAEAATRDHSDCDFNLTNVMFRSLNFHADFFSWAHIFRGFPERREIKFDLIFWFDYPINVWELKCYRSKRSRRE